MLVLFLFTIKLFNFRLVNTLSKFIIMKTQLQLKSLLIILSTLLLGFSSCKKTDAILDESTAETLSVADLEDDNIQAVADQAYETGNVSLRTSAPSEANLINGCAIVTRDSSGTTHTLTIDFGTGCTGAHGVTRKGKIIVTFTGPYREQGTVIHTTTDNYYVNNNKVEIDRTATNMGRNADENLYFNVSSTRTITFADGTTISGSATRVREWIDGEATRDNFDDDIYRVNGTGTFTNRRGISGSFSTQTPLIRKVACHQFVEGIVKAVRDDDTSKWATIDFGNGDCDDIAVITLSNGRVFTKTLRR